MREHILCHVTVKDLKNTNKPQPSVFGPNGVVKSIAWACRDKKKIFRATDFISKLVFILFWYRNGYNVKTRIFYSRIDFILICSAIYWTSYIEVKGVSGFRPIVSKAWKGPIYYNRRNRNNTTAFQHRNKKIDK